MGSSKVLVVMIINLPLLTTFSRGEKGSRGSFLYWEAAADVELEAAVALLLKQMLPLYSAVLLDFAVFSAEHSGASGAC